MKNKQSKKNKKNIIQIIVIIVAVLLVGIAIGFFLLKDNNPNKINNDIEEPENNKEENKSEDIIEEEEEETNNEENNQEEGPVYKGPYKYQYKDGVLTTIYNEYGNPRQKNFVIDGIILVGDKHGYQDLEAGSNEIIDKLARNGYKKEGINSSFYQDETIKFYIDTKYVDATSDIKIMVLPHKTVEEYEKMSLSQLQDLATSNGGFVLDYQIPDGGNHNYIGNGIIGMNAKEGKYDVIFTYQEKIAYFIDINITAE